MKKNTCNIDSFEDETLPVAADFQACRAADDPDCCDVLEDDDLEDDDEDAFGDDLEDSDDSDDGDDQDADDLDADALYDALDFDPDTMDDDDDDDDDEDQDDESGVRAPVYEGPFKSGFVALVGRPNAGKSTLVNAIMGEKVVITSPTAQTTRHRISAIYNEPCMQMILVDTPGLHKPVDALGEELNVSALNALKDVDIVAMLVDGSQEAGRGDDWVAQHVAEAHAYKILVITKADLVEQSAAQAQIDRMSQFCQFDDILVLSATEDFNVDSFLRLVADQLPLGPRWFPEDMRTDQRIEVLIAEFIREKVLLNTRDEVPHSVGVTVDQTRYNEKRDLSSIFATIYVEREGQKGIVIGAGGKMIKRIGCEARRDLQRLLGNQVFLKLNVKVKPGWRTDAAQIRKFGYGEGA